MDARRWRPGRFWAVVVAAVAVVAGGVPACGGGTDADEGQTGPAVQTVPTAPVVASVAGVDPDDGEEEAGEPEPAVDTGQLVWIHDRRPADLHHDDPDNQSQIAAWVRQGLVEGLFTVDRSLDHRPELLDTEPEVTRLNSGRVTIDYRLRSGLQWSDGEPLTADDVAYTYGILVDGCLVESDRSIVDASDEGCTYRMPNRLGYELITNIEVVSETEFSIDFASFYAGWKGLFPEVFAEHAFGADGREVNDSFRRWRGPDGILPSSGPLVFSSWDDDLVLGANVDYHGSTSDEMDNDGPAPIDSVRVVFLDDVTATATMLADGRAHLATLGPRESVAELAADPAIEVSVMPGATFEHLGINLANPHLGRTEVREAIAHAVDKAALVEEVYQPLSDDELPPDGLGNTYWMPWQSGYEDHQSTYGGADPEAAATALEAAGYRRTGGGWTHPTDGRLELRMGTTAGTPGRDGQWSVVAAQLTEAGFAVVDDSRPGGRFLVEGPFAPEALLASETEGRSGDPGRWDLALFSWTAGPWPGGMSGIYRSGSGANPYGFANPEFDVAATDCDAEVDDALRIVCYNRLDRFATTLDEGDDGLFVIPLTVRPRLLARGPALESYGPAVDLDTVGPLPGVVDARLGG